MLSRTSTVLRAIDRSRCAVPSMVFAAAVVVGSLFGGEEASAQSPYGFGFQPFGFYQPYGSVYRSSIPNPPYFATNPPVYYGSRHFRPYGVSPFASPPVVSPGCDYRSQVAPLNQRRGYVGPVANPFICKAGESSPHLVSHAKSSGTDKNAETTLVSNTVDFTPGKVRTNPFATSELQFASR
ncbi:hypothetical protein LOC71_20430 [Rhodopirellula sp. JC740]|uniref:Uncharacterized protein n=1 Tax=Rhodopirellula halodulae TaxID=2894198 RepID=A0ABS8NM45_9BACT|nr:hypothetical protein [Rhodopirellula sp. JC740]MCC9644648.1 hypothetical protein [Rhodopirellula sp. JC740]